VLTERDLEPRAGCEDRRELSDLLSIRLANVVIVDDESHWQKPRDVDRDVSSRSGAKLCERSSNRCAGYLIPMNYLVGIGMVKERLSTFAPHPVQMGAPVPSLVRGRLKC
jgi:hypothetical protein